MRVEPKLAEGAIYHLPGYNASVGKLLIAAGVALILVGILVTFAGRLPGDLSFRRGNLTIFLPLGASVVLSIVLTVLLNLFFRGR